MVIMQKPHRLIEIATSDDGAIRYAPIGNDRLIIDGRDVYQGEYCSPVDGKVTGERVPANRMDAAAALMQAVREHNDAQHKTMREEAWDRWDRPDVLAGTSFAQEESDEIAINGTRRRRLTGKARYVRRADSRA